MRGKPKVNQAVIVKHVSSPIVMHIDEVSEDGGKCTCVWHDKIGAPYKSQFNTEILESYKVSSSRGDKEIIDIGTAKAVS